MHNNTLSTVIVGLDNVLSDARWREHLAPSNDTKEKPGWVDWLLYNDQSKNDPPVQGVIRLVNMLHDEAENHICHPPNG